MNIYDAHVHLGPSGEWLPYLEPSVTAEEVIEEMDKEEIDKCIIFPNPAMGDKYPELNDIIKDAQDDYPDRFVGFGRVDPRRGDEAVDEVKRCNDIGLKGIKLHPFVETYRPDHPSFAALFDTIYELDMVILSHTGNNFASPGNMRKILEDREDMKLILGHLNEGCISVVDKFENVYVDTSGSRVYMLEHAVEEVPDKIVFGSDFPYLHYKVQKTVIEAADVKEKEKEKIFWKNLDKLFEGF